jgi:hypothetical protein
MKTKLASAFGLAMLAVAFSFSTSFACPETSQTTASIVESTVSETGMNVAALAEASAPEGQVGEVVAPASVTGNIEAPSTEASAPSAIAFVDAILVEITETVTVVVPGQNLEKEEGAAVPASAIVGIEPSVTEASSQAAAPESEAKATPDPSMQTGTAELQIEVAEPAPTIAAVELLSTDVNTPPAVLSVDAVPVEITVTMTIVVPGQTSEDDEGAAIPAGIAGIEPSLTEEPAQIEVAEPAATVVQVKPPSTDVNAPPTIVSVDAVRVEITETVTVVVPGQESEDIDDVEITGTEPEHPISAPSLKPDEATTALDDGE